jgi:hypothetical protein
VRDPGGEVTVHLSGLVRTEFGWDGLIGVEVLDEDSPGAREIGEYHHWRRFGGGEDFSVVQDVTRLSRVTRGSPTPRELRSH